MKKLQFISLAMLALTISGMAVNAYLTRFPDWAVRAIGVYADRAVCRRIQQCTYIKRKEVGTTE
jgi:hypothetical protein